MKKYITGLLLLAFAAPSFAECLEGDCRDGKGKRIYHDGTYEGDFSLNFREGNGSFTHTDGGFYEGGWMYGVKFGKGKHTYANGDFFEGGWIFGVRSGEGKEVSVGGAVYQGGWLEDMRHGFGQFMSSDGSVYQGGWVDGKRSGKGKYTHADGSIYEGDWLDGSIYEGDYFDDNRAGTHTDIDGSIDEGSWLDKLESGVTDTLREFFALLGIHSMPKANALNVFLATLSAAAIYFFARWVGLADGDKRGRAKKQKGLPAKSNLRAFFDAIFWIFLTSLGLSLGMFLIVFVISGDPPQLEEVFYVALLILFGFFGPIFLRGWVEERAEENVNAQESGQKNVEGASLKMVFKIIFGILLLALVSSLAISFWLFYFENQEIDAIFVTMLATGIIVFGFFLWGLIALSLVYQEWKYSNMSEGEKQSKARTMAMFEAAAEDPNFDAERWLQRSESIYSDKQDQASHTEMSEEMVNDPNFGLDHFVVKGEGPIALVETLKRIWK
jgi:hypothetical protein